MKIKSTIAAAILSLSALYAVAGLPDVPREFAISKMGQSGEARAQFVKLWAALQYYREPGTVAIRFTVIRALPVTNSADPLRAYQVQLENNLMAVALLHALAMPNGSRQIALVVADGVWTKSSPSKAMPLYREADKVPPPTKEEFLALIRGGRTFPLLIEEPCGTCMGDGQLGVLQSVAACPDCFQTGKRFAKWILKN